MSARRNFSITGLKEKCKEDNLGDTGSENIRPKKTQGASIFICTSSRRFRKKKRSFLKSAFKFGTVQGKWLLVFLFIIAGISLIITLRPLTVSITISEEVSLKVSPSVNFCTSTFNIDRLDDVEREFLLFAAPKTFDEVPDNLKAWQQSLKGRGHLILFSNDLRTHDACRRSGISVLCIEHTNDGFPRFDSMMKKMEQLQTDGIVAFANADLEISESSISGISRALRWLCTNTLDVMVPGKFREPYSNIGTTKFWLAALNRWNRDKKGNLVPHAKGGFDIWAWNVQPYGPSLLPFDIPPFRYPLASYDNWLFDMVNKAKDRNVIDATVAATIIHDEHLKKDYAKLSYDDTSGHYLNRYLALNYPLHDTNKHCDGCGTSIGAPYVLESSTELSLHQASVYRHIKNRDQHDEEVWKLTRKKRNNLPPLLASLPKAGFTMEEMLSTRANDKGYVLLTAITYNYREYLVNLMCNLERIGKSHEHLVIAALDPSVYEWGVLQGLPIFLSTTMLMDENRTVSKGYDYGSEEFKNMTKLKSTTTLAILEAGYSVVYSDVDITWFVDPFEALHSYMNDNTGLTIQSNGPYNQNYPEKKVRPHESVRVVKSEKESNGYQRLNSGLYVAPNSAIMRRAFQEIVQAAKEGKHSEQPYFYKILCYDPPSRRVGGNGCEFRPHRGDDKNAVRYDGVFSTYLPVHTLDRLIYPNGAVMLGPDSKNIYRSGAEEFQTMSGKEVVSAHNNWVVGRDTKKGRQINNGWWYLRKGLCAYRGDNI